MLSPLEKEKDLSHNLLYPIKHYLVLNPELFFTVISETDVT